MGGMVGSALRKQTFAVYVTRLRAKLEIDLYVYASIISEDDAFWNFLFCLDSKAPQIGLLLNLCDGHCGAIEGNSRRVDF